MAQTTYRSLVAVTLATREAAYNRLGGLVKQLERFDLNLVSVTRDANNFVVVTLSNPLPATKVAQLNLEEVP